MAKTQATKRAIGEALVSLCQTIPFHKISVQELAQEVGINRQTFYYHFSDTYQLLCWFYLEDSLGYLKSEVLNLENWEEQALKMLKSMQEKNTFYQNTVTSNQEILMNEFTSISQKLFTQLFEEVDVNKELSEADKEFYARFFSYGCSGVLIHWILEGFQESALTIAAQLFRLAKDTEFFSYQLYE